MSSTVADTDPPTIAKETITTTTIAQEDNLTTPLLLSSIDENEQNSNQPTEALTLEDEEETVRLDDYVGFKAAVLSLLSGFCILLPSILLPISLFLPWVKTVVHGYLHTGNTTLDKIWDYELPVTKQHNIFYLTSFLLSCDWFSVGVLLILSLFILPPTMLGLNVFGVGTIHYLSVLQARHSNYEHSQQHRNNINLHFQRHHERLGKMFTTIEYVAKYTQFGVYMPALITACLSKLPFHFGGSFAPNKVKFPHNYLNIKPAIEVSFGQFFYAVSCALISFVVVLLRFHWYDNMPSSPPQPQPQQYEGEPEVPTEEEPSLSLKKDKNDNDDRPTIEVNSTDNKEQPITIVGKKSSHQNFWVRFVLFESGLLTALCIAPIVTLPMIQIDYEGLLQPIVHPSTLYDNEDESYTTTDLAKELHSFTMTFGDIVSTFSENSGLSGLSKVVVGILWVQIVVLPALSLILATMLFVTSQFQVNRGCNKTTSNILYKLLRACYSGSSLTVFAITVISIAKVIPYVSDEIINNNKFCQMIHENTINGQHQECLTISVYRLSGTYIFLLCGILLDIFSIVSLQDFQKQYFYE